jgi:hypothetical protein
LTIWGAYCIVFIAKEAAMKNLLIVLFFMVITLSLNCAVLPKVNSGYLITKDLQKIEFKDSRIVDEDTSIHIFDQYSTHTVMKRDLKEVHLIFDDKDYLFYQ